MEEIVKVREAFIDDVDGIYNVIKPYVENGELLPRTQDDIADHIRNFVVAEINGEVVGCMAIKFYSKELVEFRTLAVKKDVQKRGIGKMIVNKGIDIVRKMGVKRIFVLTRSEEFFVKLGFEVVKKEIFPEKVWSDCILCPKLNRCDEIAMIKKLV